MLFAIPRFAGWLAHWSEWVDDPENKIYRPFQNYQARTRRRNPRQHTAAQTNEER